MTDLSNYDIWFVTGSQHLYGVEALNQVAAHSQEMVQALNSALAIPTNIVYKPVLTTSAEITALAHEANTDSRCVGIILWMHTFSPAKNWIAGLQALQKPQLHFHTQFNRDIPWANIDMDFMNLNQAAHGDREFGFIMSRMRMKRKVIVGHWQDSDVQQQLGMWARAACGWRESQSLKLARFGDNMRFVAVTEGDKVEAQLRFGYEVNGYGVGDLVEHVNAASESDLSALLDLYEDEYDMASDLRKGGARHDSVREAARIELGIRSFLEEGGFNAFTTTFEDLHGLAQLPGLAVQRLMADGYGFAGEGDWKTAALVRIMKVMAAGLDGGTSFMEDYTYHFHPNSMQVLGAHMLEICPSIADGKASIQVHPLGIGGKADPARLVFNSRTGTAVNVAVMDVGNRFRMVLNMVDVIPPQQDLPKLPVARALWHPQPDLKTAATAWIYAGGAHHTVFSLALTAEQLNDYADIAGIEFLKIDNDTKLYDFKNELRWNDASYLLSQRL